VSERENYTVAGSAQPFSATSSAKDDEIKSLHTNHYSSQKVGEPVDTSSAGEDIMNSESEDRYTKKSTGVEYSAASSGQPDSTAQNIAHTSSSTTATSYASNATPGGVADAVATREVKYAVASRGTAYVGH